LWSWYVSIKGLYYIIYTFVFQGGLYIFLLFDHYACSGMTLLFFATLQAACVGWVYGEMSLSVLHIRAERHGKENHIVIIGTDIAIVL